MTSSRTSRGAAGPDGGQRSLTGSLCDPSRAVGDDVVVGEDDVDEARRGVGGHRLDVVGQVEAGGLAVLGRDVADVDAHGAATPATASRMRGISRLGRMLVKRLPGPRTMSVGLLDRAHGVLGGRDVVGRQPDPLDARRGA